MKRLFTILITLTLLLGLTACGQVETQRGKKLVPGDLVEYNGNTLKIE